MRIEDREINQDQQQADREHEAERRRLMREASNAFAASAVCGAQPSEIELASAMRAINLGLRFGPMGGTALRSREEDK